MLLEIEGDLLDSCWDDLGPPIWRVIPTNGARNALGRAVMGRGLARQIANRLPEFPAQLGKALLQGGNVLHYWGHYGLITFPVKRTWVDRASPALICQSCKQLVELLQDKHFEDSFVLMPRVGCGNGGLDWQAVRVILEEELEAVADRIAIIYSAEFEGQ